MLLPIIQTAVAGAAAVLKDGVCAVGMTAGPALAAHAPIRAGADAAFISRVVEALSVLVGLPQVRAVGRGRWTLGAALSRYHVRVAALLRRTPLHQTLDISINAMACSASISGVRKFHSIWVLLPSIVTAITVVLAAGPRQRVCAGGAWALLILTVHLAPRTHTLLTGVHWAGELLSIHKHTILKVTVRALGTALSWGSPRIGAGQLIALCSSALDCTILTPALLTGVVRVSEVLPVTVDTLVVGTEVTGGAALALHLAGVQARHTWTLGHVTDRLPANATAATAGLAFGFPLRTLLKLHPIQHTNFADGATQLRVYDGVRALGGRTFLLVASHVPILAGAVDTGAAPWGIESFPIGVDLPLVLTHLTCGAALTFCLGWVSAVQRGASMVKTLTGDLTTRTMTAHAGVQARDKDLSVHIYLRLVFTLFTSRAALSGPCDWIPADCVGAGGGTALEVTINTNTVLAAICTRDLFPTEEVSTIHTTTITDWTAGAWWRARGVFTWGGTLLCPTLDLALNTRANGTRVVWDAPLQSMLSLNAVVNTASAPWTACSLAGLNSNTIQGRTGDRSTY